MSFEFDIDPKDAASAEFMTRVHRVLIREMMAAARQKKLSRADIARLLDVDKAVVSRALNGKSNLTIRTISELCWAIGVKPRFEACEESLPVGCNDAGSDYSVAIMSSSPTEVQKGISRLNWSDHDSHRRPNVTSASNKHLTKFEYAR